MHKDFRRIHHLTELESKMLLLFRHLSPAARESLVRIAEMQVEEDIQPRGNVVSLGTRTINK